MPHRLTIPCGRLAASASDEPGRVRRFQMVAYTGGLLLGLKGFDAPAVVNLAGLEITGDRPILREHDPLRIVGHSETITNDGRQLVVEGAISGVGPDADEVRRTNDNGFPWQASIGAAIGKIRLVHQGELVEVNGQSFVGPVYVVEQAVLQEISFVPIGADGATSARIAATGREGIAMTFEQWLMDELGLAPGEVPEELLAKMRAKYDAKYGGNNSGAGGAAAATGGQANASGASGTATIPVAVPVRLNGANTASEIRSEMLRCNRINTLAARFGAATEVVVPDGRGGESRLTVEELQTQALQADWSPDAFELRLLRGTRATPARVQGGGGAGIENPQVLAAALCQTLKCSSDAAMTREFGQQVMDQAHSRFRGRIGLKQLLITAARTNGFSGYDDWGSGGTEGILRAAFSTKAVAGILSNTANKIALKAYEAVGGNFQRIAKKRSVSDFKTITSYRMTGDTEFKEIAPDGVIPHGTMEEESYSNKANSFGRMSAITYQDIRNDDLGAFEDQPRRLGRGGAQKLQKVGWLAFLDNTAFFTTGRGNLVTGAGGALSSAGLKAVYEKFLAMKDADGNLVNALPWGLVVPGALEVPGMEWMQSAGLNTGGASSTEKVANKNIWAGKFELIPSAWLDNATMAGYSATAYYLIANPEDIAVIEVCYLDGVEAPTIETMEADFNTLGLQSRGVFHFGVAKQDWRGGVRANGA